MKYLLIVIALLASNTEAMKPNFELNLEGKIEMSEINHLSGIDLMGVINNTDNFKKIKGEVTDFSEKLVNGITEKIVSDYQFAFSKAIKNVFIELSGKEKKTIAKLSAGLKDKIEETTANYKAVFIGNICDILSKSEINELRKECRPQAKLYYILEDIRNISIKISEKCKNGISEFSKQVADKVINSDFLSKEQKEDDKVLKFNYALVLSETIKNILTELSEKERNEIRDPYDFELTYRKLEYMLNIVDKSILEKVMVIHDDTLRNTIANLLEPMINVFKIMDKEFYKFKPDDYPILKFSILSFNISTLYKEFNSLSSMLDNLHDFSINDTDSKVDTCDKVERRCISTDFLYENIKAKLNVLHNLINSKKDKVGKKYGYLLCYSELYTLDSAALAVIDKCFQITSNRYAECTFFPNNTTRLNKLNQDFTIIFKEIYNLEERVNSYIKYWD